MRRTLPLIALLSATACVAEPAPTSPLADSEWRFTAIDGAAPAVSDRARMEFQGDRLGANVGCNGMGGEWRITDGRLIVGPLMGTRMYCEGPVWGQEQAIGTLLAASPRIEITGNAMQITSAGHSAVLERLGG